jgi:putative acetyltransferase
LVEIREVKSNEAQAAREVMFAVCQEIWGDTPEETLSFDPMLDYDGLPESYRRKGGIFLVIADGEQVVGSGAVRCYESKTAEIKRVWLLKPYRGKGLGKALMQMLIDFARQAGYERIWLQVGSPELQPEAIGLYEKFGFYPIPVYHGTNCTLGMEKLLSR